MKKIILVLVTLSLILTLPVFNSMLSADANAYNAGSGSDQKTVKKAKKALTLCGSCGELKGGEKCCAKDAKKCSKCSLNAGSPGCCKIKKGKDVKLCSKCGDIAGSEKCCAKDAKKCSKCGLNAGSPACCKVDKTKAKHKHN